MLFCYNHLHYGISYCEKIYSFQLENCAQPAIITKDLCMVVYGRDSRTIPRSIRHFISGSYKNAEANRIGGVYETVLKRAAESGSPGLWFSSERIRQLYFRSLNHSCGTLIVQNSCVLLCSCSRFQSTLLLQLRQRFCPTPYEYPYLLGARDFHCLLQNIPDFVKLF